MTSNYFNLVALNSKWSSNLKNSIKNNSKKILEKIDFHSRDKSSVGLIVGKVQSGKTSNIIGLSSESFDHGFKIIIILFSDQNSLFNQNYKRVLDAYSFDLEDVKIFNFSKDGNYKYLRQSQLDSFFDLNKKLIFCSMKHKKYTDEIRKIIAETKYAKEHVIIVDDEGDDITQNTNKEKYIYNNSRTPNNDSVVNLKKAFNKSTYLTVTATPQTPLLLQSYQDLALDFLSTIEPGSGYLGLYSFHSGENEKITSVIEDHSDLIESHGLPESFIESFLFYLIGGVKRTDSKREKHSMIVHSTKKINEQDQIFYKIKTLLDHLSIVKQISDLVNNSKIKEIYQIFVKLYNEEKNFLNLVDEPSELFIKCIQLSNQVSLIPLNSESDLKNLNDQTQNLNYFIVVGGDMLDRGLTIEGLTVNYFTREPIKGQIDTMLQRARWFGYKEEYKQFCRVYLTKRVSEMFSSIIESEDDLWTQLKILEKSDIKIKDADVSIYVPNNDLKPTSSSKVKLMKSSIKPWFVQKYFSIHKQHQIHNIKILNDILYNKKPLEYKYKQHEKYVIEWSELKKYFLNFKFSDSEESVYNFIERSFKTLNINNAKIDFILMRKETGEERSLLNSESNNKKYLNNLMQGRNEDYLGDRNIIEDSFMLQVHYVKIKEDYLDYRKNDQVLAFSFGIPENYLKVNLFKKDKIIEPKSLTK